MKKFFALFVFLISIFSLNICFADNFDTNYISVGSTGGNGTKDLYKYWVYSKTTGTRYILRVYDWKTGKYIAVPKEYYINHIKKGGSEIMYLGVDKVKNGQYNIVRSGSAVFPDKTYVHILEWFNNPNIDKFGLTKNDVNFLAQIIKEEAIRKGNTALANNMQKVIDGIVPYDVRAEILFLMKIPGTSGNNMTATVAGKGSMENYSFSFYQNGSKTNWRWEYITYLETKAIAYRIGDDSGIVMKAYWLDKVACALYEQNSDYVFVNGAYQCSCDLYKRLYGSNAVYGFTKNQITLNQSAYNPSNKGDRRYMYFSPGRCGIPLNISGTTYYLTPGKSYNINGSNITVNRKIKYTGNKVGIESHEYDYLKVVTSDPKKAVIYEGWDYITSKLASLSVIAVDRDTGNIIRANGKEYSEFLSVGEGSQNKNKWEIDGYTYLGYMIKSDFNLPKPPVKISDTNSTATVDFTKNDVQVGAKKQIVFIYEKGNSNNKCLARISIYGKSIYSTKLLYEGDIMLNKLAEEINVDIRQDGKTKYSVKEKFDSSLGYEINTNTIEEGLNMDLIKYEYLGHIIKTHEEYFLTYVGNEVLSSQDGDLYNVKDIEKNKVHIILVYSSDEIDSPEDPPIVEEPEKPKPLELKFSIDIIMEPTTDENQYIKQVYGEDYWVLDQKGKVYMKLNVIGGEGLAIKYNAKIRFPFDVYMNGQFIPKNTVNNLEVTNPSMILIADMVQIPIWTKEEVYNIEAVIDATCEGYESSTATASDNIEIVGRLYDFTIINIDGGEVTGDEKWKVSLFPNEKTEYKAQSIPLGQITNQPQKYNYGIKLGTNFYFNVNTKGLKNNSISITPKFYYASKDGKIFDEVKVLANNNGMYTDITSSNNMKKLLKLNDGNLQLEKIREEMLTANRLVGISNRYDYGMNVLRSIGDLSNINLPKQLSLPHINYPNEFNMLYGVGALEKSMQTPNSLLIYASHWYGRYQIPSDIKVISLDPKLKEKSYSDGFIIVCFKIISQDEEGGEYLAYSLPRTSTQWDKENLSSKIELPRIYENGIINTITYNDSERNYAPVMIYDMGVSVKDNMDSVGTH